MELEFVLLYRDWANAASKALDNLINHPEICATETIDFDISPPDKGQFQIAVKSNGRTVLTFPVYDTHPPFRDLREWMERICDYLANGEKPPESVGINCIDYNIILSVVHVGWDGFLCDGETRHGPVSYFMIHSSGHKEMDYTCFCRTKELIYTLHNRLLDGFNRYKNLFNDPSRWHEPPDLSGKDALCTADSLASQIFSIKIARIHRR